MFKKVLFFNIFLVFVFGIFYSQAFAEQAGNMVVLFNESARDTSQGEIVVIWNTNVSSESKVIYDTVSHGSFVEGYTWSSQWSGIFATLHAEILDGIPPGLYYVRPVSRLGNQEFFGKEIIVDLRSSRGQVLGASVSIPVTQTEIFPPNDASLPPVLPSCENPLTGYFFMSANTSSNRPKEVRKLQTFLRDREGFTDVIESGIYDKQTIDAVKIFQVRYRKDVLDPWGLSVPTGNVYRTTQKKINELVCPGKSFSLSNQAKIEMRESALKETLATTSPILATKQEDDHTIVSNSLLADVYTASDVQPSSPSKLESVILAPLNTLPEVTSKDIKRPLFIAPEATLLKGVVGPFFAVSHQIWSFFSTVTVFVLSLLAIIAVLVLRKN